MSQKRPVNGFKQVEDFPQFKETFIKHYYKNSDKGYFLEVDFEYPKKLFNFHRDLPFLPESKKTGKYIKLLCDFPDNTKKY